MHANGKSSNRPPRRPAATGRAPTLGARLPALLVISIAAITTQSTATRGEGLSGHWFGGGGPGEGVVKTGVWSFDQYTPSQADSLTPCAHGSIAQHGAVLDPQGWVPSPESNVLPRVEMMDPEWIDPTQFPDSVGFGNVGGGVLAFYADIGGQPGFLPFHLSLMESPVIEAAELGLPGDPLALVFSSLSNPDPALALLRWVVGVRYHDGVSWTPWTDQRVPFVPGRSDLQFELPPVPVWAAAQFRIGLENPGEVVLIQKKGPAADKAKAGTKPPSVTDEQWKYVPDIQQEGPTCAGASVANCLAYWAKRGYPEITPAGTDTTKRHQKLRDELIKKIYGEDKKVGGDGANRDNWGGGITEFLKEKGVGGGKPQPAGRAPLVHRRIQNTSPSLCDSMMNAFGQCHDVMFYFKWCDANGNPVKDSNGNEPAHLVTMGGVVKTSDGRTVVHGSHGWGAQTDTVTQRNRDKAYDKFEFECVGGKIRLKNEELLKKHKRLGADHLCVTEINVVKPGAAGRWSPPIVAARSPLGTDRAGRSLDGYAYTIVNDEAAPIGYFAMILEVPYQDVQTPPGWSWQPLPAPFPDATDCDQWLTADGILWTTSTAPVIPGASLSGFGFAVDSSNPADDLGAEWYTQTAEGSGIFGFVEGPVPATSSGASEPPSTARGPRVEVHPNPARGAVTVRFALPEASGYRVEIFDAAGRRVRSHEAAEAPAGAVEWRWDGVDDGGRRVASGAYFCRVSAAGKRAGERIIVLE